MTGRFLSPSRLLLFAFLWLMAGKAYAANYLDYYKQVAQAEHDAVSGRHAEAIREFSAVFRQYPYNNPIDCYVAAQLAAYTGDRSGCAAFLRSGLSFGLPIQTIRANPHLAPVLGNEDGMLRRQDIDSCWQVYRQRVNPDARAKMMSLIRRDQAVVRSRVAANGSIYDRGGYTLKSCYQPLWDSLLQEIVQLTKTSGFPAQKVIGTMNGDDSLFNVSPNSVWAYFILIHHGNTWPQLETMLWEELAKGNITPQMYGALHDNSDDNRMNTHHQWYFCVRPCDTRTCRTLLDANEAGVSENRRRIGLCSYETMEQKFKLTRAYRKWTRDRKAPQQPVFDFQPDLHFM